MPVTQSFDVFFDLPITRKMFPFDDIIMRRHEADVLILLKSVLERNMISYRVRTILLW